jgi:hypothetical protein
MVLPAASLMLNACVFGGEEEVTPTPPATGPCVEVSGETLRKADSLVGMANDLMVSNFQYWSEQDGEWQQIKRRNPQAALDYYDKALQVAPGHCQAIFGRAVASASLLTQDPKMDAFIRKMDDADLAKEGSPKIGSMAGLMKMSPDQAPQALLKVSGNLNHVDRPTVREAQQLIEQVVMPKLDSTIKAMEKVMDYDMFAIRFSVEGDTLEIDRSEVGPGLAGLKVMKSFLTVVAGHEWEVALGGKYDWVDTLSHLRMDNMDNLRPAQTQALDHLTGLFAQSSPFSKVRSGWREKVQGIPALLLEAVGDAQKGLRSTIDEARTGRGQEFDPWRAGGVNADVDTADLRITIEALERCKKYLQGEVPISYAKDSHILKVNFPRLFQIDGLQGMLPYFKFLPYGQWNDTVSSDTTWHTAPYGYFTNEAGREALGALGLGNRDYGSEWDMYASYSPNWADTGRVMYYGYADDVFRPGIQIAEFFADADDPCSFSYVKHFDMAGSSEQGIQWNPHETQGRFRISLCREADGKAEFASLLVRTRGPIEFTDAAGATTLAAQDLETVDEPEELTGKIIFRDPTFGGIFPELTNANLWDKVQSVKGLDTRTQRVCDYEDDPAGGYERWKCSRILAENPSDLDYIAYALLWWDDIL